jgi:anaerobic selenocysteine-containing dehydrogenase
MTEPTKTLPTVDHLGFLEDQDTIPRYVAPDSRAMQGSYYSCAFCGVGDGAATMTENPEAPAAAPPAPPEGEVFLRVTHVGGMVRHRARMHEGSRLVVETPSPIAATGSIIVGQLEAGGEERTAILREAGSNRGPDGAHESQNFVLSSAGVRTTKTQLGKRNPTGGCIKMQGSLGLQRPVFPIHLAPSVLDRKTGTRQSISYAQAIARFAELLLAHRPPAGRTLIYACGQVDYFAVFAFQEVYRLLGVGNLTGNAEHCLNAGAVHNEILTGQEGPFLTVEQSLAGPGRFYLLNGWNGMITHPPIFHQILKRKDLDAYLVEVAVTESAQAVAQRLGPERVLLVRSGSDPHLALAVAHEVLTRHPQAVDRRFIEHYADAATFEKYAAIAGSEEFAAERVAARIAPEPSYQERLAKGIRDIAAKLARPDVVPINLPSVGLSQTKGAAAHCLWGSLLGMLGKYGLRPDGSPAGGTLRIPGQIDAETEVQGLSRRVFMGRIPITEENIKEVAGRMGLPGHAYKKALDDTARPALDYSDPADVPELFLCFGTQFESNMMERSRWIRKLESPNTSLVVVDPIPDPFTLEKAELIIPSPPHAAAAKLYQNGEWRLSLSVPRKKAAPETRTDATIVYDSMAEISRRLRSEASLREANPDLAALSESGYLQKRFESAEAGGGLPRADGEVSRPELWARVIEYMSGGKGPLYCRPEHADGRAIEWAELIEKGSIVYGGVGTTRYRLDYDNPKHSPFGDIFRQPRRFTFFAPTEKDLELPDGIILNSGRSTLSDDRARIRFAVATFNSGKATSAVDMPEENPLHISPSLAESLGLSPGDRARVTNVDTGESLVLPVVVTDRVKGQATYVSFHKCRAEVEHGRYLNTITSHAGRCPYTSQSNFKSTRVRIERVEESGPAASEAKP